MTRRQFSLFDWNSSHPINQEHGQPLTRPLISYISPIIEIKEITLFFWANHKATSRFQSINGPPLFLDKEEERASGINQEYIEEIQEFKILFSSSVNNPGDVLLLNYDFL